MVDDVSVWTERALAARRRNPRLKLRLLTSEGDFFLEAVTRTSKAWTVAGIDHDFAVARGPHDYVFNRGPGSNRAPPLARRGPRALMTWNRGGAL